MEVQLGLAQRSIDYSNLLFPDVNESFASESKSFVGVGVLKTIEMSFDKSLELGMTHFHLNKPNTSFTENTDKLPMRHQLQANLFWQFSNYWELQPSLMYQQQGVSRELFFGTKKVQLTLVITIKETLNLLVEQCFDWAMQLAYC